MRYLRVFLQLVAFSFKKMLVSRTDFVARLVGVIIAAAMIALVLVIPFQFGETLAGWSRYEVMMVLGVFYVSNGLSWMLFREGISQLEGRIRNADLDWILVRPVSAAFLCSFADVDLTRFTDIIVGLGITVYSCLAGGLVVSVVGILAAIVAFIMGIILTYCLYLVLNSMGFWVEQAFLEHVANPVFLVGKFPVEIWGPNISKLFFWVIPLALMSVVPVGVLTGRYDLGLLPMFVLMSVGWVIITSIVWRLGVRKYLTAGS